MKKVTKMLTFVAASSCLLFGTATMASNHASNKSKVSQKAAKPINLLFVIKVKKAKLTHIKGKDYSLSFDPKNVVDGVLAFSDRPNRVAFRMSFDTYINITKKGPNSFASDSANIVLNWDGTDAAPMAYKMVSHSSPSSDKHTINLTMLVRTAHHVPPRGGTVTIYVDSVTAATSAEMSCLLNGGVMYDPTTGVCREGVVS